MKPLKPEVTIDDFGKLIYPHRHRDRGGEDEKSDKLLKLTVNSGLDTRTILSGIAKHYTPEEMVGRQSDLYCQPAPRKMMGIESQGMILMAGRQRRQAEVIAPERGGESRATVS